MTNEQIKAIFLAAGFKEKDQGEGRMDLNPYVYHAARALLTAQLAEMGWFPCSPELLQSGACCATAPRVLGGQGTSHYHQAVAEPAWYEHTLRNERGAPVNQIVSEHAGPVFGKPDVDYDKLFSVSVVPLFKHADPGDVERLRQLSVTNILMGMTPGLDGMGNEHYAQSVGEVEQKLGALVDQVESLQDELAQCEAMANMVAEREWAEHVGTGPVSSKVEAAFTQLHNELQRP